MFQCNEECLIQSIKVLLVTVVRRMLIADVLVSAKYSVLGCLLQLKGDVFYSMRRLRVTV